MPYFLKIRTDLEVLTPLPCRNTMISRMTFWSAQPDVIFSIRFGPIPRRSLRRSGSFSMTLKTSVPKAATRTLAQKGPIPFTMPEPRYFSMPLTVVGA